MLLSGAPLIVDESSNTQISMPSSFVLLPRHGDRKASGTMFWTKLEHEQSVRGHAIVSGNLAEAAVYLGGVGEHELDHLLRPLRRLFEEQLDGGGHQLQLHLSGFFGEGFQEELEQLVRVVDAVRVLADDPDHAGLGLRLIQRVQVLTQRGNDALIPAVRKGSHSEPTTAHRHSKHQAPCILELSLEVRKWKM